MSLSTSFIKSSRPKFLGTFPDGTNAESTLRVLTKFKGIFIIKLKYYVFLFFSVLNITRYEEGKAPEPVLGAIVKQNGKQ